MGDPPLSEIKVGDSHTFRDRDRCTQVVFFFLQKLTTLWINGARINVFHTHWIINCGGWGGGGGTPGLVGSEVTTVIGRSAGN